MLVKQSVQLRIREVNLDDDQDELIRGGTQFWEELELPFQFNAEAFLKSWEYLLESRLGIIFFAERDETILGAIGGICTPSPYTGLLVAEERFLYVYPEHRKGTCGFRLLKTFERWAKSNKAVEIRMGQYGGPGKDVGILYKRYGLEPFFVGYSKILL